MAVVTTAGKQISVPEQFELRPLSQEYLSRLKLLNSVIFPVKYHDTSYQQALACGAVSQLAFEGSTLVGAIMCRLEALPDGTAQLYIISLGVLAPYRGVGLGSALLQASLTACAGDPAIHRALLHVHSGNEDALKFYARHGFTVSAVLPGYYKRLEPPDATLLVRDLQQQLNVAGAADRGTS